MPGSGDEMAPGGRGPLRASDADREQVVDALKAAFVQGRLTKDEFDLRVGQVFASRTYADLGLLTADIPAGPAKVRPPKPAQNPNRKFIARSTVAVGGTVMVTIEAVALQLDHPILGLVAGALVGGFAAALLAGFLTFLSWVFDSGSGKRPSQGALTKGTDTRSAAPAADPVRRPPYTLATAAS